MAGEGDKTPSDQKLFNKALIWQMQQMFREFSESVNGRLERLESAHVTSSLGKNRTPQNDNFTLQNDEEDFIRRPRQDYGCQVDNLRGVKIKIPTFQGKPNPEAYLE